MLRHFEEPLFPRNVSTASTHDAQYPVESKERAMVYYNASLGREDYRIACYPNYEVMENIGAITPGYRPKVSHLFIDLDLDDFAGDKVKLDLALKTTLRNIKRHLNGAIPTLLWSGGGFHVHQPLDSKVIPVFEELPEFKRYADREPSVMFMRYAAQALTAGKADHNHHISFKSCMTRVPGSHNLKYLGDIGEVRIVQCWNGVRARPTVRFMLTDFLIWLVQADLEAKEELRKIKKNKSSSYAFFNSNNGTIAWIEKLIQTPIPEWRKTAVALIIAPYLLTTKGLSYNQAYDVIMQWAERCNELSRLRPSDSGFRYKVRISLNRAQDRAQRPMKWETLIRDYSAIYETLHKGTLADEPERSASPSKGNTRKMNKLTASGKKLLQELEGV